MARIVMKFGGTSMAGIERIRRVAGAGQARGRGAATRCWSWSRRWPARPTGWCSFAARPPPLYDPKEYDVVVASGEQVTAGLLAMTLRRWAAGAQLHGLAIGPRRRAFTAMPGSRRSKARRSTRR